MQAAYWISSAIFVLLWFLFAIHCYRNDKIYRLLGLPSKFVKLLWFLFFITFSPFALIAYLILGIIVKEKEYRSLITHAAFTILFLFCSIISLPKFITFKPEPIDRVRTQTGWQKKEIEAGQIVPTFNPFTVKFHAGFIQSNSNVSSISAITSGSAACLPFSRIAIVLESNSPIVYESALVLMEKLKEIPVIESIEIYPLGTKPESGGLLADAWIRLGIITNSEIMIPPILRLNSAIKMTVSREPYASMHGYQETYSLPFISYNLSCELNHRSMSLTVGTGSAKYDLATKDIGKELFKAVNDFLTKNLEKYGSPPKELKELQPQKREYNEPPLQVMRETAPAVEGHVPMANSMAYWKLPILDDVHLEFDRIATELEASDWIEQDRYEPKKDTPYLRYKQNNDRIVVFTERMRSRAIAEKPTHYIVQYERRMEPETIQEKVKDIVAQGCSTDFLLMAQHWIRQDEEFQRIYLETLEKTNGKQPALLMQKAQSYGYLKEYEKQWRTLHEAMATEQLMGDAEESQSDIKSRIKIFREKHAEHASEISWKEIYESLGAREMSLNDAAVIERKVRAQEPLAIFSVDDNGNVHTVSAVMVENNETNDETTYSLRFRCRDQHGGSEANLGGTPIQGEKDRFEWDYSSIKSDVKYNVYARTIDDEQFLIRLEILEEI